MPTIKQFFLISCFVATCFCGNKFDLVYTTKDYWKNETPIKCYDCNSAYDPRCGDPFDPYSIGMINCTDQPPPEHLINPELPVDQRVKPTVCRKIVQKIDGQKRVIRECGYLRDKWDDKKCLRRTGTSGVEVYYCACRHSLCNPAIAIRPKMINIILISIILMAIVGN